MLTVSFHGLAKSVLHAKTISS